MGAAVWPARRHARGAAQPLTPPAAAHAECDSSSLQAPQNGATVFAMRHGNRKAKLGRPADQRKALIRSLTTEVLRHGKIKTTKVRGRWEQAGGGAGGRREAWAAGGERRERRRAGGGGAGERGFTVRAVAVLQHPYGLARGQRATRQRVGRAAAARCGAVGTQHCPSRPRLATCAAGQGQGHPPLC